MFRIRFHGRGGQGMKTASRIVGTAAFRAGYYAQDSPVYGAERRGAPMVAFTRFDSRPILERGIVSSPDFVVIADASILDDPLVCPLQGLSNSGSILINSTHTYDSVAAVTRDFTGLALKYAGSTSALSVALGAAAAKLAGLDRHFVDEAVRAELQELKLGPEQLESNVALAEACFAEVRVEVSPNFPPSPGAPKERASLSQKERLVVPTYDGPWAGTASVASAPNTPLRKTGDWRVMRPVIDQGRCTHCWICFLNCPDGAITLAAEDVPRIDYGVCKGCLVCAEECPIEAIETPRETELEEVR
jgi:pyruvate ferredoxin oxidoreductase gamma subunit